MNTLELIKDSCLFGGNIPKERTEEVRTFLDNIEKQLTIPDVVGQSEQLCPKCESADLFDIDDHYTKCQNCGFTFVGA